MVLLSLVQSDLLQQVQPFVSMANAVESRINDTYQVFGYEEKNLRNKRQDHLVKPLRIPFDIFSNSVSGWAS